MPPASEKLRSVKNFTSLISYLRTELRWPIESDNWQELTYDYNLDELGLQKEYERAISNLWQLKPLDSRQPWGIFFVEFKKKKLPIVVLRRILRGLVIRKRASAAAAEKRSWAVDDLLFISALGDEKDRELTFAHFKTSEEDLPTLRVLGWDGGDTFSKLEFLDRTLHEYLVWPEDTGKAKEWLDKWSKPFRNAPGHAIRTARELAEALAQLAIRIRDAAKTVMKAESERGKFRTLHKAFKESLIHDLEQDDFADTYAQTITYGLLTAAISRTDMSAGEKGTAVIAENVADMVPVTNPFLKEILQEFLQAGGRKGKLDFDELGVQDVAELLRSKDTNLPAVIRDFGNKTKGEDPVIHFYEHFLAAYDKEEKKKRGVFYTPQPVVSYIVRSVHELLQTEFGLTDGLADTTTWGEMLKKHPGLKLPPITDEPSEKRTISPDEPFVQILDPATGTATFLMEVIDVIYKTLRNKWAKKGLSESRQNDLWNEYVPKHLLPRLHAYELMMAPYVIAHMKIGLKLAETGYRFGTEERARIYLTNALEPWVKQLPLLGFDALAHEAAAVNEIKRHKRFTVVIGNPPYSFTSQNLDESLRIWVESYRSINGVPIKEKGALQAEKAIQDDYIKFMRFAECQNIATATGLVGMISSHGYLDNPTLRGMRYSFLSSFDAIRIFDLHGNSTRKERCPDGSDDKNVFDIKQGVAITLASRQQPHLPSSIVRYAELWGPRESKYTMLDKSTLGSHVWVDAKPEQPFYLFKPHDAELREEFDGFHKITEMMPTYGIGCFTSKDHFVIGLDADELVNNAREFRDSRESNEALCERLGISIKDAWNVTKAREQLRKERELGRFVRPILYRPFDYRFIFYHPSLVWSMSKPTMQHMVGEPNLAFAIGRAGGAIDQGAWNIVTCANSITDLNLYRRGGNSVFPLYLKLQQDHQHEELNLSAERRLNFSEEFLKSLSTTLAGKRAINGLPACLTPEDIFHYAYAVFHSPGYRSRYAELLKIDFPRLPLTGNLELFQELARLGGELTALHLLESPKHDKPITEFIGGRPPEVEKVSWSKNTVWIDKAQTIGFQGVPEEVWNFHIGGYQVCEKWLKDRKGRKLSKEDISHYQKVVVALSETIRLMKEIDEVIEKHGGWPGAFSGK